MNARTIMITASAMFVLAAPAAQANLERIAPAKAKIAQHHKVAPKQHKNGIGSKASRTTTLYIYFPAPLTPPTSFDSSADDCANYIVNCTDEQNCSFWSVGCSVIVSSSTSVATPVETVPVETIPVETAARDNASTQSTPVDNAASIANALNCPGGGVWDEDYEYCV
jgi:hypothetical protein